MSTKYKEIKCKKGLDSLGILGTRCWTRHCFDPYINCEFNCVYCNMGIQRREGSPDSSIPVHVKINAPQILANELSVLKRKGVVSLGVATDIYQPAEKKYGITRQILETLKDNNCPFAIGTKSDLVLRDLDLISEAAKKSWCCVSLSIPSLDENLAKMLEPNAPSPRRRLEVVKKFADKGIIVGIWFSPIIPYVTDNTENIESVIEAAVKNGAKSILAVGLDMRDPIRFKRFYEENFPRLEKKYETLYDWRDKPNKHYPDEFYLYDLYRRFISTCQKYKVESYIPHFYTRRQGWLFYLRNFSRFNGTPTFELTQLLNYLSPSKEILQTVQIRVRNSYIKKGILTTFRYFPH